MELVKRDLKILKSLYLYEYVFIRHIVSLCDFPNEKKCSERMSKLEKAGYVSSIEEPEKRKGRPKKVFSLNRKRLGEVIKLLNLNGGQYQTSKVRPKINLNHHLLMVEFLISLKIDAERIGIQHSVISELSNTSIDAPRNIIRDSITLPGEHIDTEFIPDIVFHLKDRLYVFDADAGTETIQTQINDSSSIEHKLKTLLCYLASEKFKKYDAIFKQNFSCFRFCVLTTTQSRQEKILELVSKYGVTEFLLVAHREQLLKDGVLAPIWHVQNGSVNPVLLEK